MEDKNRAGDGGGQSLPCPVGAGHPPNLELSSVKSFNSSLSTPTPGGWVGLEIPMLESLVFLETPPHSISLT